MFKKFSDFGDEFLKFLEMPISAEDHRPLIPLQLVIDVKCNYDLRMMDNGFDPDARIERVIPRQAGMGFLAHDKNVCAIRVNPLKVYGFYEPKKDFALVDLVEQSTTTHI